MFRVHSLRSRITLLVAVLVTYGVFKSVWRGQVPAVLLNCSQPILLAHRGLTSEFPENSIESVSAAVKEGYAGVEVDVHFYDNQGLVIRHDPRQSDVRYAPDLTLSAMFGSQRAISLFWWIDLKNLSDENVSAIAEELTGLVREYHLADKILVESPHARELALLRDQVNGPLYALWHQHSRWSPIFDISLDIQQQLYGPFVVSVEQSAMTGLTNMLHGDWGLATWTVNDPDVVDQVTAAGARIILTDVLMKSTHPELFQPFEETCK